MQEVYSYPITYPEFWLNSYPYITWVFSMLFFSAAWAVFFKYGEFKYGIDLGCVVKTFAILIATMLAFGLPQLYNIKFEAENGHQGDKITLTQQTLTYETRYGEVNELSIKDIKEIYQEPVTFNPPVKYFVVSASEAGRDSITVKKNLPGFSTLMEKLQALSDVKLRRVY